jgi:aerobic C4-dicarboxylate transport protein
MAAVFIAQAFNINLPISDQITMLLIMLLTSKGAAAVAGGGFICLAATLSAINTGVPVVGLALLLGVDWFMATCRALTNLMGNCVAGVVVARWEDSIDMARFHKVLNNETVVEAESPEQELIEREEKGWAKEKA